MGWSGRAPAPVRRVKLHSAIAVIGIDIGKNSSTSQDRTSAARSHPQGREARRPSGAGADKYEMVIKLKTAKAMKRIGLR
jgi:hypothetical protein